MATTRVAGAAARALRHRRLRTLPRRTNPPRHDEGPPLVDRPPRQRARLQPMRSPPHPTTAVVELRNCYLIDTSTGSAAGLRNEKTPPERGFLRGERRDSNPRPPGPQPDRRGSRRDSPSDAPDFRPARAPSGTLQATKRP